MILADTSIWISHLRSANLVLAKLLEEDVAACHPWVIGELAMGSIKNRSDFLRMLEVLPRLDIVAEGRVLAFVERHRLFQRGIGWVDAQLLAASAAWPCRLWTHDKRLAEIAQDLGIGWSEANLPL
jgi:predicted nucleic acid-binding protein